MSLRLGLLLATLTLGCTAYQRAGWKIGWTLSEYQGQVLCVKNGGPGGPRAALEEEYDPTIRHFVQQNGEPDYLYVIDRYSVQFMYVDDDRLIYFQRSTLNPKSAATVTDGIPEGLASLFSHADQERLAQARAHHSSTGIPPTQGP